MKPRFRKLSSLVRDVRVALLTQQVDSLTAIVEELRNRANKHGWFPEAENASAPPGKAVPDEVP